MGAFDVAKSLSTHLVVQPQDLRLNPPDSYLFVQDGLIVACGVLYALWYLFYMIRTYKDKTVAGPLEYTFGTMAYGLFYAFVTTSTWFEFWSFLVWFLLDLCGTIMAIISAVPPARRIQSLLKSTVGVLVCITFLRSLTVIFLDDREQVTAYWTGIILQLPVGWFSVYLLFKGGNTEGQLLEIWITRYLGCYTAYGVFVWRYVNNPEAWSYIGSVWILWIILLALLPETAYPFVYLWIHKQQEFGKSVEKMA